MRVCVISVFVSNDIWRKFYGANPKIAGTRSKVATLPHARFVYLLFIMRFVQLHFIAEHPPAHTHPAHTHTHTPIATADVQSYWCI